MECKGYNGTITADEQHLTITHTGMVAKAGGLLTDTPRSLPLQAISGVHFKRATRLGNGHITLGLGGADAADVGSQAASNPDTVIFRHKDGEAFEQLHTWLVTVVEHNKSAGIDQSSVEFEAAGATRLERMDEWSEKLAEKASTSQAESQEKLHTQQTGKMTNMLGDDRPDIVAAAARMGWRIGGKRELKQLAGHLNVHETVELIAQGTYNQDQGILVLTDTRLLFLFHGLMRQSKEDFPLRLISSVQTKSGLVTGEIKITVSGASSSITGVIKSDLHLIADAIRKGMTAQSIPAAQPVAPAPAPDAMDQLRKLADLHAAGVLTDDEFNAKKTELLDRM